MKNYSELTQNFYDFIKNHSDADVSRLCISTHGKHYDFPIREAICQIECRQKTSRKLHRWISDTCFLFPCREVAEQSTHQCVAAYHAMIAGTGKRILDITAGLGIDAFTLAENGNDVTAIELDPDRSAALKHNAECLGLPVKVVHGDSLLFLKEESENRTKEKNDNRTKEGCDNRKYDIIFADPARRDSDSKRLYFLHDCLPDIVTNFELLCTQAHQIIIKASPILDLTNTLRTIPYITDIHIVCVRNECKEVLIVCQKERAICQPDRKVAITVSDLEETIDASIKFRSVWRIYDDECTNETSCADISEISAGAWLYDPNAGIHKLNCGAVLCNRFTGLKKISPNTDLYISESLIPDFPGRIFRIIEEVDKGSFKKLKGEKAEVVVRNYTMKVEELRKKLGVKSGDEKYLFGFRSGIKQKPMIVLCERLS